jgi:hypothetical protein
MLMMAITGQSNVASGIPATRRKRGLRQRLTVVNPLGFAQSFVRRAGKPGSTAGKDACRYIAKIGGSFLISNPRHPRNLRA